ncbi:MAG: carotenoid oxygenase family protein [Nostocaceae cyanobacterium]|nr:carotenoid oxygenase family protein [Nostocaceae cyanobacterium]
MHKIDKKSINPGWAGAIAQPGQEFPLTPLSVISGGIPPGLRGTLYCNGPARLERGGIHVGHWFDGDGAVLAVHFTNDGATGVYRYVQTAGYQQEAVAGKLLYGNYGMTAPGPIWNQWLKPIKNTANTSVLALSDKLLALWEGGNPHALNLQTLETYGLDDLGGLEKQASYSAHPKVDPETVEIFNFGISIGRQASLNLYKSDFTGKIVQKAKHQLDGIPLIHDFVLAGQYLVFFAPPLRLQLFPVILGTGSYSDSLQWKPQLGTQILVFDRESLSLVSRGDTEPWFQWHFANGYVDDSGTVVVDIAAYSDFTTNQFLEEVPTGKTHTAAKSTLTRVQLNPQTAKVTNIETILDRNCEFPIVPPQNLGKVSPHTYLSISRQGTDISKEILNAIARFDHQTATLTEADLGENRYPSEAIYTPNPENPEQGWILTVIYDGNSHSSEVWVFDADRLDAEPICRLALPSVIPHSFHSTWKDL